MTRIRNRLRLIWAATRGRPIAHRVHIEGGTLVLTDSALVVDCLFTGNRAGPAIEVR